MNIKKILLALVFIAGTSGMWAAGAAGWNVEPTDYRYGMSLYMDCNVGSGITDYNGYTFGAFVGEECRGVGKFLDDDRLSGPVLYMKVYSNVTSGETVTFKAYDSELNSTYPSLGSVEFKSDEAIGLPSVPYTMDFYVAATSVSLSNNTLELLIKDTATLTATVSPSFASDKTIVWTSSDSGTATVANGVVTAVAKGEATVTATTGNGLTADCNVVVTAPEPNSVKISMTEAVLVIDETLQLTATLDPEYAESALTWSTDNATVATVSDTGLVTAVAKGSAVITVSTANGKTATCTVTVNAPEPTAVRLDRTSATLTEGETLQLTATLDPSNAESALTWSSDNATVATVSDIGLVTAVAKGSAVIRVSTANGKTATCTVTVNAPEPTVVKLDRTSATLTEGETLQLTATLDPSNAESALTWSSDNTTVATVSDTGLVTAVAKGSAVIKVSTANGKTATCTVTVNAPEPTAVRLDRTNATLTEGETLQLTATLEPTNAEGALTWSSDNASVATVSATGLVTAVAKGSAVITVSTANGKTATCAVKVNAPEPTAVILDRTNATLTEGETLQLTATLEPTNTESALTWSSDNTSVATVSDTGLVTAVAKGSAVIKVSTANGKTATCTVTVNAPEPTAVILDRTNATLTEGETLQLTATLDPSNAESALTWSSDNASVATVSYTGLVTAIAKGSAVITVSTANGKTATCAVMVNAPEPTAVRLDRTTATLTEGETLQLTATLDPSNAEGALTWSSDNASVATVSATGLVTAVAKGSAVIKVSTANGKAATCAVTVNAPEPTAVRLDRTTATLTEGETLQLTATLDPSNAESVLTWSSDNTSVATVSATGLVTAVAKGSAVIKVSTANGKAATCAVTVNAPEPTAVRLDRTTATLTEGETLQLTATLDPSNAESVLTWSSDNTSVATVSATGLVTAVAKGSAVIKVSTANGKTATCTVTVNAPEPILPESIELSETSVSLSEGESLLLVATVTPEDSEYTLLWNSENEEIATVNDEGLVKAISKGLTTITVSTDNGLSASCEIIVLEDSGIESIIVYNSTVSVYTMNGVLLKSKADKEYLQRLGKGTYIIRMGSKAIVIMK